MAAAHAAQSAAVTHAHPEAQAGAIAVAVLTALAWQLRDQPADGEAMLEQALRFVPESVVRERLLLARSLPLDTPPEVAAAQLGNGSQVSCQDTVPFALWCAATRLDSYEEAIWWTLRGLGDCDTTCAIVGGIVALRVGREGIPAEWRSACEALPDGVG
jgi:ADP-ribosylglycohydrolase